MNLDPRVRSYAITFGSRIGVIALTAITGVISARLLGPTDKGIYTVATLLPSIVSTIAMLAGPQLVLADISRTGRVGLRLRTLLRWSLVVAVSGGLICAIFQLLSAPTPFSLVALLGSAVALIAPALITPEYYASNLQARNQFGKLAVLRVAQVAAPGSLMLLGVIWIQLYGALAGFITGALIVGGTCHFLWRRTVTRVSQDSKVPHGVPWRYVLTTNFTLVALFLSYRIDVLVLNGVASAQEVGVYSAGVALAELVLVASMSAAVVRAPVYAREAYRPLALDSWLVFGISCIPAVAIALLSPTLVPMIFGSEYQDSTRVVWALLPGVCFLAAYRFISAAELVRGHKFGILISCLISILVDVILIVLIAPHSGAVGAGIAASTSYAAGLGYLVVHRKFRRAPRFGGGDSYPTRRSARLGVAGKDMTRI